MKRNIYLKMKTKDDALNEFLDIIKTKCELKKETIKVVDSLNRISAKLVLAKNSNPYYNSSAMDGILTNSNLTLEASEDHRVEIKRNEYLEIDTGDYVSDKYDTVIMAEDLIESPNGYYINKPYYPYENIRTVGEDIVCNEVVITANHLINASDIGAMIASGIKEIEVYKKPRVLVIPTGDELIEYHHKINIGEIYESNGYMLKALAKNLLADAIRHPIIKDDYETIKKVLLDNVDRYDVILINAGSSAGRDDYTVKILNEIGIVYTHGILIKPAKPTILSMINQTVVIGISGFPSSAYLSFNLFAKPVIEYLSGLNIKENHKFKAVLAKSLISSLKYEEYVRVKLGIIDNHLVATPLKRGAGSLLSLVKSDGYVIIPKALEGYKEGDVVDVIMTSDIDKIKKTIIISGSHDMMLDLLDNSLKGEYNISSTHIGSLAGLIALKNHNAHLAPMHIFNPLDNTYNLKAIMDVFDDTRDLVLIKGVKRIQGLIIPKGNPLKIKEFKDIKGLRYINRQKGAGTRILFDYLLKENDLNKEDIVGYKREVSTHMEVAEAIKSNSADVGMGVYSSAKALDLDFIRIKDEEYDFVTRKEYLELDSIKAFIKCLQSEEFKKVLEELGGYDLSESGKTISL